MIRSIAALGACVLVETLFKVFAILLGVPILGQLFVGESITGSQATILGCAYVLSTIRLQLMPRLEK